MHWWSAEAGRFCAGPETFTLILQILYFLLFWQAADFHNQRGIWRESEPKRTSRLGETILFQL